MKRTRWLFGGFVVAGILAIAAVAQPGPGLSSAPAKDGRPGLRMMKTHMRGRTADGVGTRMMRRLRALDLSSDQWSRIREIRQNMQKQIIPKRADVRVAEIELRQMIQVPSPDMGRIDAKITEISAKRADIQKLRVRELMQIRNVLTDEQRQKFLDPASRVSAEKGIPGWDNYPMFRRWIRDR